MMVSLESALALTAFSTAMIASPGPANLSLMASGATVGFSRSLPFLIGIWLGLVAVMVATAAGLGGLLAASPVLYGLLKIIGFAYICYLALQIFRMPVSSQTPAEERRFGWREGMIIHPLNPKAYMTAAGAYAVFVSAPGDYARDAFIVSAIILLIAVPLNCMWCASGSLLQGFLQNPIWRPAVMGGLSLSMIASVGWAMLV